MRFLRWAVDWIIETRHYLIMTLIPMFFAVLLGFVFSPIFVDDIPIVIYDMDHSENARTVIDCFYDSSTFKIIEDYDNVEQIEGALLMGKINGAVIIPESFGAALSSKSGAEATVLVDGSNIVIANNVQMYATTIFTMANANIQMNLLAAGGMVPYETAQSVYTMNLADRTLFNPQTGYLYYLFPGLIAIFAQQSFLAVIPTVLIEEKKKLERLPEYFDKSKVKFQLGELVKELSMFAILNTMTTLACFLIIHFMFSYPLNGNLGLFMVLHILFLACLMGVSLVIATVFDDTTHASQFTLFLTVPTILSSGYVWPEFLMASGFAPIMKLIWPLYYYCNPLKDLILKGSGWNIIAHYIFGGAIYAVVWISLGLLIYSRKIRLLREEGLVIDKQL